MKSSKQWIPWFCSLLLAVQGIASAAWLPLSISTKAPVEQMMHMAHCHMPSHQHNGAMPKCCGDQCLDMANCFSPAALSSSFQAFGIVAMPALSPPQHRMDRFAPPDPDTRLRPPTALLG